MISPNSGYVQTEAAWRNSLLQVSEVVDLSARFPRWVFRVPQGHITIFEFDVVVAAVFGDVLARLAAVYGDTEITVVVLDPPKDTLKDLCGRLPSFILRASEVVDDYGAAIFASAGSGLVDELAYHAENIAIVGTSKRWGVWAQRDWEIGILLTQHESGPWLGVEDAPGFSKDFDIVDLRSPEGWDMPLTDGQLREFRRNFAERGTGGRS